MFSLGTFGKLRLRLVQPICITTRLSCVQQAVPKKIRQKSGPAVDFDIGLSQRKATLGAEYVEKNLAAADELTRPFQEAMTAWCWGFGWGDQAIDVKERSMMNLAMIGALGKMHEWELHCRGALNNGVTPTEIRAIVHVIGIYCGVPQAVECFRSARKVLEAEGQIHMLSPQARDCSPKPSVRCIALTGGPCGGKSSALDAITRAMKDEGVEVFVVPEAPTIVMQGGGVYPGIDGGNKLLAFETAIIKLQLQLEQSFRTLAMASGKPTLIICDRGVLDIAAYLPREAWLDMLKANQLTEEQLLGRYDAVLHLVSAADGAEEFYNQGHVKDDSGRQVYRAECPMEARALDQKVQQCWSSHRKIARIANLDDGFHGKLDRACAFVKDVMLALNRS